VRSRCSGRQHCGKAPRSQNEHGAPYRLLRKCSGSSFLLLRGSGTSQKPKENADSSSRLLLGMTANEVSQQTAKKPSPSLGHPPESGGPACSRHAKGRRYGRGRGRRAKRRRDAALHETRAVQAESRRDKDKAQIPTLRAQSSRALRMGHPRNAMQGHRALHCVQGERAGFPDDERGTQNEKQIPPRVCSSE
jgi:hypothetical protein